MITNVILHLINELPVVADLEELPAASDRSVRCTNVRTVDGKRPAFVHDRHSTFVFPLSVVRLIEAPPTSDEQDARAAAQNVPAPGTSLPAVIDPALDDEEPDADLLARIRSA